MQKPRILCTGMNKLQCTKDFFLKQQLEVVPSHYSLIRCLEDMGYEVEQRPVSLGEDLSSYEEVIVYIHSIQSFCQFIWSGLYAVSARPDCILAFDDWQFDQIIAGIQAYKENLEINPDTNYREYLLSLWQGKEDLETIKKFENSYKEACDIILSKKNRLLMSAFAGGNIRLLKLGWDENKVFTFNPNPYHLNRKFENAYGTAEEAGYFDSRTEPKDKKRVWNFASLVQLKTRKWLEKQKVEWDVIYYGSKRGKFKSERKTEPEMCKVFEEQWGCLMPGYFHDGSGWWRARYLQVAEAGSILVSDPADLIVVYNNAEAANVKPGDVESMNLKQLTDFAQFQKECIYKTHPLIKEVQQEELRKVLNTI